MLTPCLLRYALLSLAFCFPSMAMENRLPTTPIIDEAFFERCQNLGKSPNDFINQRGTTALMIVCQEQKEQLVNRLVGSVNLNINAQDKEGNTALHYAAFNGNKKIVALLLAVPGINVGLVNNTDKSAYELAYYQAAKTFDDNAAQEFQEIMIMLSSKSKL